MKAKVGIWMPLYIGDYLSDTMHLTTEQHGAYLLIIMAYWKNGGELPGAAIQSITRLHGDAWGNAQAVLSMMFSIEENGNWRHERIERELLEAGSKKDAATAKAKAGAAARWGKAKGEQKDNATGNATSIAQALPKQCPSPSPSPILKPPISPKGEISEVVLTDSGFEVPDDLINKWAAAYPKAAVEDEIAKAAVWAATNPAKRKKNWARFLNGWIAKAHKTSKAVDEGDCPVDKIIELYHKECANLPRVAVDTDHVLRGLVVERWNEAPAHKNSSFWKTIFQRANRMQQIYYRGSNVLPRLELICSRSIFRQLEEQQ